MRLPDIPNILNQRLPLHLFHRSKTEIHTRALIVGLIVFALLVVGFSTLWMHNKVQAASVGPRTATSSTDCTNDASTGSVAWSSPGNAAAVDSTSATDAVPKRGGKSNYLKCLNFGFTTAMIPTGATINGVVATVGRSASAASALQDNAVRLVQGGTIGTTDRSTTTQWPTSLTAEDHGSSTDLWGATLAVSDVTAANFGIAISVTQPNGNSTVTANIDYIQVTIYYTVPPTLTQRHYIFQNDNGANVNSNSANGTADTALTNAHKGERLAARIQVDNTSGGDFTSGQFKLQYDKNDNNWNDVASWTDISPGYGTSGSNGDALTSAAAGTCTGGTTFSNGTWQEGVSISSKSTIAVSNCSEVAFMIDTRNAINGTTYRLRLYDFTDSATLNTYSIYPTLTIVAAASETVRAGKNDEIQMATCSDSSWECQMLESSGNKGQDTSLAFAPDGTPWISYRDGDNSALKLAQYVGSGGTGCDSTAWTCTTIYTGVVQRHTSLAFDKAGVPWIAFTELYSSNGYLSYAQYVGTGGNCTSTAWSCAKIDELSNGTPSESFMSLDFSLNNQPWISYYSALISSPGFKVAAFVGGIGPACSVSTGWSCTIIDVNSAAGKYSSLRFDHSGTAWVSYSSSTTSLEVAKYVGTGGSCLSSAWTCENVDGNATTNMGDFSSIAFDSSNTPWVTYHDKTTLTLKIAQRVGSGGSGCMTATTWTCTTIDDPATGDAGWYTSLTFNQANQPIVASTTYASAVGTLRFARYVSSGGSGCSNTAWTCTSVDTSASTGVYASLAVSPSGTPWVGYFSDVNLDLRVAKLALPTMPTYLRYDLDNKGYSDTATYDSNSDSLSASANAPVYRFDSISSTNTNSFYPVWVGQSTTAASSATIKVQVYRFGTTNAWTDLVTNSSCAANADCSLTTSSISTNLSEYYESLGTTYALHFRIYQAAGSSTTFKTNSFSVATGANSSLTQADYRWYANANSTTPGSALASQDAAGTLASGSSAVRLRMNVGASTANLPAGASQLKLQYSTSTSGPWTDVGASGDWCNATTGVTCNSSWLSRRKITFDNSASSENLANFPVMVRLDSTRVDYTKTQNSGQDIRFVDPSDPTTVLPYQIEKWDETGSSYVWVKVPQIDASSTTDYIWMYYNNASAADGQAASSVWTNNYGAVWHLSETSGAHNDSTGNGNSSSSVSVTTQGSAVGKIDGADTKTNASTQSIQFPSSASDSPSGSFTVEAWVKADVESPMSNFRTIINKESASTTRTYWLTIWDNALSASCPDRVAAFSAAIAGTAVYACGTTAIADGNWHHVAGVYDGSNLRVFVDGNQEGSTAVSGALGSNSSAAWVGNVSTNTARSFAGTLDEVRVSNTNRDAAWMASQYKSENDTFATFGSEQGNTSGGWGFYDNTSVSDGAGISTLLTTSNSAESYEENNPTVPNANSITSGQKGEWDFALDPSNATLDTAYYFRLVVFDGTALSAYTNYPQLTVSSGGGPPTPSNDQLMRHGTWFYNGVKQPFTF